MGRLQAPSHREDQQEFGATCCSRRFLHATDRFSTGLEEASVTGSPPGTEDILLP